MSNAKRKPLSKKIRFEVFKRDKFTCQYCGRMAPDVILEVDHIEPVADGGSDDLLNLITSCRDCNRGKGKTRIDAVTAIRHQQEALIELAEKREQTRMMFEWKKGLVEFLSDQADMIADYIFEVTGYELYEAGFRKIKKYLSDFSFPEVMEAVDISFGYYFHGDDKSWNKALNKIGGICYTRRKQNENQ